MNKLYLQSFRPIKIMASTGYLSPRLILHHDGREFVQLQQLQEFGVGVSTPSMALSDENFSYVDSWVVVTDGLIFWMRFSSAIMIKKVLCEVKLLKKE